MSGANEIFRNWKFLISAHIRSRNTRNCVSNSEVYTKIKMYNYTLDELQEWYGRKNNDVSISAKPLVLERLKNRNKKYSAIAEKAIEFVADSYAQQPTPLSIRQIHYYLVHKLAKTFIEGTQEPTYTNTIKDYNLLTKLILQARIAGKDYKYKVGDIVILKGMILPKTSESMTGKEGENRDIDETEGKVRYLEGAEGKATGEILEITQDTPKPYLVKVLSGENKGWTPHLPDDNIFNVKIVKDFANIKNKFILWHMISETESLETYEPPTGMDPKNAIRKALAEAAKQPGIDPWDRMNKRVVVFTEKRELQPQLEFVTNKYYVKLISMRGYGAWSRLYKESLEYKNFIKTRKKDIQAELHAYFVTDHDPSGLDINRLYASILKNFWNVKCIDCRVMLKKDQIDSEDLPPAPTKVKDPRAKWYMKKFSTECWEVDALGREKMQKTLEEEIKNLIDWDTWKAVEKENKENAEKTMEAVNDPEKLNEMMKDIMKGKK